MHWCQWVCEYIYYKRIFALLFLITRYENVYKQFRSFDLSLFVIKWSTVLEHQTMFTCLGCNVLFCAYSLYSTGLHTVHCRVEWFLKFKMDWALSMLRQIVLWPKFQNITLECCTFVRYTVPKEIDFPRYSMKCSGENVILAEYFM